MAIRPLLFSAEVSVHLSPPIGHILTYEVTV